MLFRSYSFTECGSVCVGSRGLKVAWLRVVRHHRSFHAAIKQPQSHPFEKVKYTAFPMFSISLGFPCLLFDRVFHGAIIIVVFYRLLFLGHSFSDIYVYTIFMHCMH